MTDQVFQEPGYRLCPTRDRLALAGQRHTKYLISV